MKKSLNFDWEYTDVWSEDFLNGKEKGCTVNIPHNVSVMPLHAGDHHAYEKISGYRKVLHFDGKNEEKRYFLQFDGAAHIAYVYFNRKLICTHRNGYTAFKAEITDLINYEGDNEICVRLDSTENSAVPPFGHVIDYLTYGGIYRSVWLEERPQAYIEDVFVKTPDLHTVDLDLKCKGIRGDEKIKVSIFDANHNLMVKKIYELKDTYHVLQVDQAKPWSPEHPHLYTCEVELTGRQTDKQEYTFGFRTITLNEKQILLNGEPFFIRGLNRHQSYPYMGYAASDSLQVEDVRILKEELFVNAVRTSHYPQSQSFIDACDRMGLAVFTEIPGWQHIGDRQWKQQAVENTKEMVLQYRNHPSIILWGVRINESLDDDDFYRATNEMAHRLDPTRPTSGVRYLEKSSLLEDVYGYNDFSHSGLNPGCKEKKAVTDEKKPLLISEANGHMYPTKSSDRQERREEHALRHARVLNDAMADGNHAGVFQWCMFDYATHKDFGSGDRVCYHGVMDAFRNPKMAAAVYASQNDEVPVLEIGSSMDIGDYDGGHLKPFYAFSNADEIRLYKNDIYVQTFKPDNRFSAMKHGPFLIDDTIGDLLKTQEGMSGKQEELIRSAMNAAQRFGLSDLPKKYMLELGWVMLRYGMKYSDGVELYGKYVGGWGGDAVVWKFEAVKDGKVVRTVVKSPDTQLHLEVKASAVILKEKDMEDMASFRIRILDANDNLQSYVHAPVSVSVNGPFEIIGPEVFTAEGGMGGTYIKTTGSSGKGSITFSAPGIDKITLALEAVKEEL